MHTSEARILSRRAGLTMFACEGRATCCDAGPWHFSQPTFHSVTFVVSILKFTEWQPSHSCEVGRRMLLSGNSGTHQSVPAATLYGRQICLVTSHCAPRG